MAMTFGSLFAGIEGFGLGLERAGLRCLFQVEREPFCRKVLDLRFPTVPKFDDVCVVGATNLPRVDWLVGGFPCQDVSVAGKRAGLAGERTGLFWEFLRIAVELNVKGLILENVPGLLTSDRGRDFHAVLAALAERGFRRSYRILDSRYFGVAQRRRRVFLVCGARGILDGATEVLFESSRGGWHLEKGRATGPCVAATLRGRSHGAGVNMPGRGGEDDQNLIAGPLGGGNDGIGRRSEDDPNLVAFDTTQITSRLNRNHPKAGDPCHPLAAGAHAPAIAFALRRDPGGIGQGHNTNFVTANTLRASDGHYGHSSPRGDGGDNLIAATLNSGGNSGGFRTEPGEHLIASGERARALTASMHKRHDEDTDTLIPAGGVRRLTPLECERLQGFPDGWTCLCGEGHRGSRFCKCSDSPRYRALGNAVTVNVAEWIGRRILDAEAESVA